MITGAQTFFLADPLGEDENLLAQTILLYYSSERQPPRELLLPFGIEDQQLIEERLTELREGPVTLLAPQRGKRMQLMQMAEANAAQIFSEQAKKEQSWETLATTLQNKLRLANRPETIECLDISNLQGKQAVGSLVCFVQGEKAAKLFRHYRIKSQDTPDDYAMMREVLERRMAKGVEAGQSARPAAARRRQGPAAGGRRCPGPVRPAAAGGSGGHCQGKGGGRGKTVPAGPQESDSAARPFAGAALPDAYPRRGPPLRHHLSPQAARQGAAALPAGCHRGDRPANEKNNSCRPWAVSNG